MAELAIDFEWLDPEGARGDELRATWARLALRVDGDPVTRVLDLTSRTVRDSLYVPLYPLAEWLAMSWWQLLYEIQSPNRSVQAGYEMRHCLRSAQEGFVLPPLLIESLGESIRLSWSPEKRDHAPIEFVGQGSAYVPLENFRLSASEFIESVIGRLDELGVRETPLHAEWDAVRSLDDEEDEFCKAAAALGLDPFALEPEVSDAIVSAADVLPPDVRDEFFSSADVQALREQAREVAESLGRVSHVEADVPEIRNLRGLFAGDLDLARLPWEEGYRVARGFRQRLGLNAQPIATFDELASAMELPEALLLSTVVELPRISHNLDLVLGYNDIDNPGFGIPDRSPEARRFALCRGLFEVMTSRESQASLITKARTERQKRNRAFAAEFLVPATALRERIETDVVSEEEIEALSAEFGVSWSVVQYQLINHGIARPVAD